jgi:hypothetical protein
MKFGLKMAAMAATALLSASALKAEIHVYSMDHNNGKLIKIKEDGTLLWDVPNHNGHDVQLLPSGNVLIVTGKVQEIDPDKKVVWELGAPTVKYAESAQRLPNGNTVIADNGQHCILEVNPKNEVVWRYDVENTNNRPDPTMRQMRRLSNGNTLICASTRDEVIEVTPDKKIVWRYSIPFPYLATRLRNGNTLISSGAGYGSEAGYYVIEVDKKGETVWKYGGKDAPEDQKLNWPSGFFRLPNGNIYISEALGGCIRVVSKDKKTVRVIKSPAMLHPCTLVVVDE